MTDTPVPAVPPDPPALAALTPHDVATLAIQQEIDRALRANYDPGRVGAEDLASAVLTALAAHGYRIKPRKPDVHPMQMEPQW